VIHYAAFVLEILYQISLYSSAIVYFMKHKEALCTVHRHLIFVLGLVFPQRATQALPSIWKTKTYTNLWWHILLCVKGLAECGVESGIREKKVE
jgi:hypothetical protein